jgi:phosphatidylinositol kinase/protein kinase (PI-3  family)
MRPVNKMRALAQARKYATVAFTLVEIMMYQSEFPCFAGGGGPSALRHFRRRLMPGLSDDDVRRRARQMVDRSLDHRGTVLYDRFQLWSNGILP